jgi:hypothetical protein
MLEVGGGGMGTRLIVDDDDGVVQSVFSFTISSGMGMVWVAGGLEFAPFSLSLSLSLLSWRPVAALDFCPEEQQLRSDRR